ncbi:MAG: hypothetical protein ACR2JB_25625 [Bryobacteraceae bacterium]
MATFILCIVRYVRLLGSGYEAMVVENFALRQQLAGHCQVEAKSGRLREMTAWV